MQKPELRSILRNQYLKCKSEEATARFKNQRNLCVTLLRKTKRDYYENLDLGKVNDSKKFWNTIKPVFGNKLATRNNITLIENKKVLTSEIELAKTFNKYFVDKVPKLGVKPVVSIQTTTGNLAGVIKKDKSHSSMIAIEKKYMKGLGKKSFNFSMATNDIVLKYIKKLNTEKSQFNDVPIKYIEKFNDVLTPVITDD